SQSGLISWDLQALDPATMAPPSDPLAGFLPPNQDPPEGEGQVTFSVEADALGSGTGLSNEASIVFDSNQPIETGAWTNVVDTAPPSASVSGDPGASVDEASVAWAGSDDAAGIGLWEIRVSKDGGPYTLWKLADGEGSATFAADVAGTYAFRATA